MAIANLSKIEQIERKTVYLYTPHFKIKLFEIATLQSICLFNHYTLYIYFDSVVLFFFYSFIQSLKALQITYDILVQELSCIATLYRYERARKNIIVTCAIDSKKFLRARQFSKKCMCSNLATDCCQEKGKKTK